jgi:hypothetical protein
MKGFEEKKNCPKCHFPQMKTWSELSGEEQMIFEKTPAADGFTTEQRRRHLFCPRCRHEQVPNFEEFC